jgi:hypothetical protein
MGQGHENMGFYAISITLSRYKRNLISGSSARSLSDDLYASHRIFPFFSPFIDLDQYLEIHVHCRKIWGFLPVFGPEVESKASACGKQIAALSVISS